MNTINWRPSPRELRRWAFTIAAALGLMGSLFSFVDWGIFAGGRRFGVGLWAFGLFALLTAGTGTAIGLPAYWAWMGFVHVVSSVIGYASLSAVFLLAFTPMAAIGRLLGRDRLQLRATEQPSYWRPLDESSDSLRQF